MPFEQYFYNHTDHCYPMKLDKSRCYGRNMEPGIFDSDNIYIEGDNTYALCQIQDNYHNQIDVIYIDPPYNNSTLQTYADKANSEKTYEFHRCWINMIKDKLVSAKSLLKEDGVIFISIDDTEYGRLRVCADEIFGRDKFVATFPWRKRSHKNDVPFGVSQNYEWILCYAMSKDVRLYADAKPRKYYETDDYPGCPWRIHDSTTQKTVTQSPNSDFTMVNPKNGKGYVVNKNRSWACTKETFNKYYNEGKIVFPGDYPFLKINKPVFRYWKSDDEKKAGSTFGLMSVGTNLPDSVGRSEDGTRDIVELFGKKIFSYPKPVSLVKYLIDISTKFKKDAIVLDFFAGSSTTAHAVMQLNAEDGGSRKYILVQSPEPVAEKSEAATEGYRTISDIGIERIRRAAKLIKETTGADIDYGFKTYII